VIIIDCELVIQYTLIAYWIYYKVFERCSLLNHDTFLQVDFKIYR